MYSWRCGLGWRSFGCGHPAYCTCYWSFSYRTCSRRFICVCAVRRHDCSTHHRFCPLGCVIGRYGWNCRGRNCYHGWRSRWSNRRGNRWRNQPRCSQVLGEERFKRVKKQMKQILSLYSELLVHITSGDFDVIQVGRVI